MTSLYRHVGVTALVALMGLNACDGNGPTDPDPDPIVPVVAGRWTTLWRTTGGAIVNPRFVITQEGADLSATIDISGTEWVGAGSISEHGEVQMTMTPPSQSSDAPLFMQVHLTASGDLDGILAVSPLSHQYIVLERLP